MHSDSAIAFYNSNFLLTTLFSVNGIIVSAIKRKHIILNDEIKEDRLVYKTW